MTGKPAQGDRQLLRDFLQVIVLPGPLLAPRGMLANVAFLRLREISRSSLKIFCNCIPITNQVRPLGTLSV